jgi:anti-sigma factor RsiW
VTQPTAHIDDELLSALVDGQLSPDEMTRVQAHLETCPACRERSDDFRSVSQLLRGLPEVELPRDFSLGPRLVVDPPNVVRLRRWYTATRVSAAALAAVFVFLSVGSLYEDATRQGSVPASDAVRPQVSAPAGLNQLATPTLAVRAAAKPAAASQASATSGAPPAGAVAVAARSAPLTPQSDDQVAAATSTKPLPTLPPTPAPTPTTLPVSAQAPREVPDPAAPLRNGAAFAGVLAFVSILAALVVRNRLQHQASQY